MIMASEFNPARKGDIVAVMVTHSHHDMSMKRHTYTRWHLATVHRSSREGIVREIVMGGQSIPLRHGYFGDVFTLSVEAQAAARAMVAAMQWPGTEWETADAIKAAIRTKMAEA
jgi:GrpB-like predicted nucleotidyltransferase (UPF0157 family)